MKHSSSLVAGMVLGVLCCAVNSWAVTITATVDRDPVRLDESFTLVFAAEGSVDSGPDFQSLEQDFDILHQSQSTNMSFIHGQMSNTRQWTLVLMPQRLGELIIPPISFGNDHSAMMRVTVISGHPAQAGARSEELFVEVEAKPRRAFVQEQILYTARLYRAVNIENASLTEPTMNDSDVVIKKLGEDRTFQTQRDSLRYHVVERRYVLFPQRSGTLTIDPVVFTGQIVPQGRSFFSQRSGQTKRVRSDAITLEILPIPSSFHGATWLPARDMQLAETWPQNSPQFIVGEPVTRTLSVVAEGLTSAQLPVINSTVPSSIKQYPDQPVSKDAETHQGIIGIREEKVALIPGQAGNLILPAIEIPWWNTQTNTMKTARLPEREIFVELGEGMTNELGNHRESSSEELAASIDVVSSSSDVVQSQEGAYEVGVWQWMTGLLVIGWLITSVLFWRYRRGNQSISSDARKDVSISRRSVERTLKSACERGDVHAAKVALLEWSKFQWPDNTPKAIGAISERASEPFCGEICRLNRALYGHESAVWKGESLWLSLKQSMEEDTTTSKDTPNNLEPLWLT